jgi:hypothetical protein
VSRTTIYRSARLDEAIGDNPPNVSGRLTQIADRYLELLKQAGKSLAFSEKDLDHIAALCQDVDFSHPRMIGRMIYERLEEEAEERGRNPSENRPGDADSRRLNIVKKLDLASQVFLAEIIEQRSRTNKKQTQRTN